MFNLLHLTVAVLALSVLANADRGLANADREVDVRPVTPRPTLAPTEAPTYAPIRVQRPTPTQPPSWVGVDPTPNA
jgi:hypothetical protein